MMEQFSNNFFCLCPSSKKKKKKKKINGKNSTSSTNKYQRIRKTLLDKSTPILIFFVLSVAKEFNDFIVILQTNEPMIHLLLQKCMSLIQTLLQIFVKEKKFFNSKTKKLISSNDLLEVDVLSIPVHKVWCTHFAEFYIV